MLQSVRNKLGVNDSSAKLETREMLSALTREATGVNIPEDGFASTSSVDNSGVAAINNAWNTGALANVGGENPALLGDASVVRGNPRVTVDRAPNETPEPNDGAPFGFPALLIGDVNGVASDRNPFGTNGIAQDNIERIDFDFRSNGGAVEGDYNNTLDVWFGEKTDANGVDSATNYLMVQNYNSAVASDPNGDSNIGIGQPAGERVEQGLTFDNVVGTYDVWFGNNAGTEAEGGVAAPTVSYIRTDRLGDNSQTTSGDLNAFITHARDNEYLEGNLALDAVYAGSEVWSGGEGSFNQLNNFDVETNSGRTVDVV